MNALTPNAPADDAAAAAADASAAASLAAAEREEWSADLREVRRLAMRVARNVVMLSLGPEPEPGAPEPDPPQEMSSEAVLKFTRASHLVRMVVGMEEKIAANAWTREHAVAAGRARRKWRNPKQDTLKRIVHASIVENADPADIGRLMDELHEILQDPALDDQFVGRRMADVATEICEGFGIRPHLRRFSDKDLDYTIPIDRSGWDDESTLPTGMVGEPGIPSVYEMQERAAGRPWPPHIGQAPPR
jgi:hypothetical protein